MTNTPEEEPVSAARQEEGAADTESRRIMSLDEINAKLEKLFEWMKGGSGEPRAKTRDSDDTEIRQQMRDELARLQDQEKRKQATSARDQRLDEHEKRLALLEKAPAEYRKVTTMLWGDPDKK